MHKNGYKHGYKHAKHTKKQNKIEGNRDRRAIKTKCQIIPVLCAFRRSRSKKFKVKNAHGKMCTFTNKYRICVTYTPYTC